MRDFINQLVCRFLGHRYAKGTVSTFGPGMSGPRTTRPFKLCLRCGECE